MTDDVGTTIQEVNTGLKEVGEKIDTLTQKVEKTETEKLVESYKVPKTQIQAVIRFFETLKSLQNLVNDLESALARSQMELAKTGQTLDDIGKQALDLSLHLLNQYSGVLNEMKAEIYGVFEYIPVQDAKRDKEPWFRQIMEWRSILESKINGIKNIIENALCIQLLSGKVTTPLSAQLRNGYLEWFAKRKSFLELSSQVEVLSQHKSLQKEADQIRVYLDRVETKISALQKEIDAAFLAIARANPESDEITRKCVAKSLSEFETIDKTLNIAKARLEQAIKKTTAQIKTEEEVQKWLESTEYWADRYTKEIKTMANISAYQEGNLTHQAVEEYALKISVLLHELKTIRNEKISEETGRELDWLEARLQELMKNISEFPDRFMTEQNKRQQQIQIAKKEEKIDLARIKKELVTFIAERLNFEVIGAHILSLVQNAKNTSRTVAMEDSLKRIANNCINASVLMDKMARNPYTPSTARMSYEEVFEPKDAIELEQVFDIIEKECSSLLVAIKQEALKSVNSVIVGALQADCKRILDLSERGLALLENTYSDETYLQYTKAQLKMQNQTNSPYSQMPLN